MAYGEAHAWMSVHILSETCTVLLGGSSSIHWLIIAVMLYLLINLLYLLTSVYFSFINSPITFKLPETTAVPDESSLIHPLFMVQTLWFLVHLLVQWIPLTFPHMGALIWWLASLVHVALFQSFWVFQTSNSTITLAVCAPRISEWTLRFYSISCGLM